MLAEWTPDTVVALFMTLVTLIATATTAIVQLVRLRRDLGAKIEVVHELVNSRLTAVLDRVDQLAGTLRSAGIDLPPDPADPYRPTDSEGDQPE